MKYILLIAALIFGSCVHASERMSNSKPYHLPLTNRWLTAKQNSNHLLENTKENIKAESKKLVTLLTQNCHKQEDPFKQCSKQALSSIVWNTWSPLPVFPMVVYELGKQIRDTRSQKNDTFDTSIKENARA